MIDEGSLPSTDRADTIPVNTKSIQRFIVWQKDP